MPYSQELADRIQERIGSMPGMPGMAVKKMFGGVGFLLNGNMACGVHGQNLIVRLPPEQTAERLAQPHTKIFDLTGKPMKGWILVEPPGYADDDDLAAWIRQGVDYAGTLPPK